MMNEPKKLGNGFLIEEKLYFTFGDCEPEYINLLSEKGKNMNYGCEDSFKIDYPGEYDKGNVFVVCYAGDDGKLNYFVRIEEKYLAIIQNPKMVEKVDFQDVKECFFTDDQTLKILERLEYEGSSLKLALEDENLSSDGDVLEDSEDSEDEDSE